MASQLLNPLASQSKSLLRNRVAAQVLFARNESFWANVPMGPKDPILGVAENFRADPFEGKVNVGVGAYRTDEGKPWVLPSVAEAERRIVNAGMDMEYPPIDGVPDFVRLATELAYGKDSEVIKSKRVAACQSLSGTGALRLASGFLERFRPVSGPKPVVLVPNPTWGNHIPIFEHAGHKVEYYRYWDSKTLGLDLKGMLEDLKARPKGTIAVLHACAHNPTGVDPTMDQWKEISKVCKDQGHVVLFDNAYQGFASGDANKDVQAVRLFVEEGHNIMLCQSFAKNFGLYGHRVGNFSIVCANADEAARVQSQVKVRRMHISNKSLSTNMMLTWLSRPDPCVHNPISIVLDDETDTKITVGFLQKP